MLLNPKQPTTCITSEDASILVVEDDPAVAALITFTLQLAGWKYHVENSLSAAANWLSLRSPRLILLDYMLPDGTGLWFLSQIRNDSRFPHLPVIMLTARSIQEDKRACFDAGADDYVTKPFSPNELKLRVKNFFPEM